MYFNTFCPNICRLQGFVLIEHSSKWNLIPNLILTMVDPRIRIIRFYLAREVSVYILVQRHVFGIALGTVCNELSALHNRFPFFIQHRTFNGNFVVAQTEDRHALRLTYDFSLARCRLLECTLPVFTIHTHNQITGLWRNVYALIADGLTPLFIALACIDQ